MLKKFVILVIYFFIDYIIIKLSDAGSLLTAKLKFKSIKFEIIRELKCAYDSLINFEKKITSC